MKNFNDGAQHIWWLKIKVAPNNYLQMRGIMEQDLDEICLSGKKTREKMLSSIDLLV